MITLYRAERSPQADRVEETLRDLVLAHRVEVVDGPDADLPRITDGERVVPESQFDPYLEELRRLQADWTRFQSDACYIADDGVCL